ncbi:uncharacterized protein V1518DRAFT_82439 [Limtongia smithiae]|uniref:uncharacterized protein n=1 Tax=Limtongia smithiae TaxID=1125753 RepID=UPI0034CFDCA9
MSYPSPLNGVLRVLNPTISIYSTPFLRAGLFEIGARSTCISLSDSTTMLIAPVPYEEESAALVGTKDISYIVAPDIEHHMAIKSWKDKYPAAKIIGPAGLGVKKAKEGVTVDYEIPASLADKSLTPKEIGIEDPLLEDAFRFVFMQEHSNKEVVILHIPTKTMIEADLLFNLPAAEQYSKSSTNPRTGVLQRMFNGVMTPSSSWYKHMLKATIGEKAGAKKCLTAINEWDFTSIVPCHGDVIDTEAKETFDKVFAPFLK